MPEDRNDGPKINLPLTPDLLAAMVNFIDEIEHRGYDSVLGRFLYQGRPGSDNG